MGRRGQGQDRRSAHRPARLRRPLQRRRQRRPHRRPRRPDLQALAAADRRPAARTSRPVIGNGVVVYPPRFLEEVDNLRAGRRRRRRQPRRQRPRPRHLPLSHGGRTPQRAGRRRRPSAPPAAASAPATRTRSAARTASASASCSIPIICASGCAPIVPRKNRLLRGPVAEAPSSSTPTRSADEYLRLRRADAAARRRHDAAAARRPREQASASCSRRPRAACSTSTTAPIPTSPAPTARRPASGAARGVPARNLDRIVGVIKAYTTRVGRGPFPTELDDGPDGIGETHPQDRPRIRHRDRPAAPLRLVRRRGRPLHRRPRRRRRAGRHAARRAERAGRARDLHVAYELDGERHRPFPERCVPAGALQAGVRDAAGLAQDVSRRRRLADLPAAARRYIDRLAELLELPVSSCRWAGSGADDHYAMRREPPACRRYTSDECCIATPHCQGLLARDRPSTRTRCNAWPRPASTRHGCREHVAIIMDGNGRWAQQRGLPRIEGHAAASRASAPPSRNAAGSASASSRSIASASRTGNGRRPSSIS